MFLRQLPARCSLYGVKKSIYRLPRSLLVVVLRSSRGESILRRDVEKRDVDVPRDRENDSGRENERIKEKGENQKRRTKAWAVLRVCICRCLHTCVCETLQKVLAHTLYEARYAEPEVTCDLEIFAGYVIANYRADPVVNREAFFASFTYSEVSATPV